MGSNTISSLIISGVLILGGLALFSYVLYLVVKALRKYTSR